MIELKNPIRVDISKNNQLVFDNLENNKISILNV
jgi:hypothetical protein